MTRSETIDLIRTRLEKLTDDQLAAMADMARAGSESTVYETLSDAEKSEIDAALDRLDRGEGVPLNDVKARLDAKLQAAGA